MKMIQFIKHQEWLSNGSVSEIQKQKAIAMVSRVRKSTMLVGHHYVH